MLSILSTFDNMLKLTISPQARRAETDPRQCTPTRAHLQPLERESKTYRHPPTSGCAQSVNKNKENKAWRQELGGGDKLVAAGVN